VGIRLLGGDCRSVLATLPAESVHCVVTSPPYFGLRDYGVAGQIGVESTPPEYIAALVDVFREVRRILRSDGTLWLNIGDSYNAYNGNRGASRSLSARADAARDLIGRRGLVAPALKQKDLIGVPWMLAFALRDEGWYLRSDIVWSKPNPMPESVTDRPTKAHEYLFLLTKRTRYYYDAHKLGKRSVWEVATEPCHDSHFATYPTALVERCITAGCPVGGTVLDPFAGAGTTGLVADRLGRNAVLIELNPAYVDLAGRRIVGDAPLFAAVEKTQPNSIENVLHSASK